MNAISFDINRFGAQLGELAQHRLNLDVDLAKVNDWYYSLLSAVLERNPGILERRNPRYLEIACYRHVLGYKLSNDKGFESTHFDINNRDLSIGRDVAHGLGLADISDLVSGDFHDLPFGDNYFDLVMISASLHHTKTPEVVIGEAMRVLSDGGLFYCQREPCERQFCFYQFNANRPDQHTQFEAHLMERDLMRVISSPFPGARNAEVFGRIENDRITLDTYIDELGRYGEIVEQVLYHEGLLSQMDKEILQNCDKGEKELAQFINMLLVKEVNDASTVISECDKLLGYSLPGDTEIQQMADRTAAALKSRPANSHSIEWQRAMVKIFGGSLRFVIKRNSSVARRNSVKFRRELILSEAVKLDKFFYARHGIDIWAELLPDIQSSNQEELATVFPLDSWHLYKNDSGIVLMVSRNSSPHITIPLNRAGAVVVRYSVVIDEKFPVGRLKINYGEKCLEQVILAQTEDRLLKFVFIPGDTKVQFCLENLDGDVVQNNTRIRVSILQCVPVDGGSD